MKRSGGVPVCTLFRNPHAATNAAPSENVSACSAEQIGSRSWVLLAEAGFNGNALAPFGAASGNYGASALGLHTGAKAVRL